MLKRILTAFIGLPGIIIILLFGKFWMSTFLLIICLLSLHELYRAFSSTNIVKILGFAYTIFYYKNFFNIKWTENTFDLFIASIFWLLLLFTLFKILSYFLHTNEIKSNFVKEAILLISSEIYITHFLSYLILIRNSRNGIYYVWYAIGSAFLTDTYAYFGGRKFGKHRLCFKISPNKTVEGAIIGIIGSIITVLIYAFIVNKYSKVYINFNTLSLILLFSSIISEFGDLIASIIKRKCKIKDFGDILPGHGGMLDRVDSLLLVSPFVYFVLSYFNII